MTIALWLGVVALWIVALGKLTAGPRAAAPDYVSGAWLANYRRLKDDDV